MKNKLLVCACTVALVALSFTSCKEKTDFDAIVDQISHETLKGYFSGAEADADALVLRITQFQFLDDESVLRTTLAVGDGIGGDPAIRKFSSWKFGEYNNGGKGRYLTLYPEDASEEPLMVNFINGGIIEENQPAMLDKNDKVTDVNPTQDKMIGKHWACNDTTWFTVDTMITVIVYDTTYRYKPIFDPETGEPVLDDEGNPMYEQIIKKITEREVEKKAKKKVSPTNVDIRDLELFRDANTHANTGRWHLKSEAYKVDKNTRVSTTEKDSLVDYDFRWSFASMASANAFVIRARQNDGTEELFEIRYDSQKNTITLDKQVLKIVEE